MKLFQITSDSIGLGGLIVKAKDYEESSQVARDVIEENHMADIDETTITLHITELVQPENNGAGYCYPSAAEYVCTIQINLRGTPMSKKQAPNSLITLIEKYKGNGSPNNPAALRDILSDIMHLCEQDGYSFEEILAGATQVYQEEKQLEDGTHA